MKNILLLCFISLCMATELFAQKENKLNFGIKGGMNRIHIKGYESNGQKTGFIGTTIYGALFTKFNIGSTTFLETEILFTWVNDWHFIEVPFHIKQMLNKKVGIFLGPKLDFAADRLDSTKQSKSDILGLSMEVGTQYNFSKRIFAEGRYSIGLSQQFRDESFDINNGKRNNLRFGFGFRF